MKQRQTDKPVRRQVRRWIWPSLLLLVALSMAGGSYYLSMWWGGQLDQEYNAQKRALDRARGRHLLAIEEVSIAREYRDRYNALVARGLIGEIDRLQWSDGLRSIANEFALPGIELRFSARQELDERLKRRFNAHEFIYSSFGMTLAFKGQHEGDLLAILSLLDQRISPMYFVEQCSLQNNFAEGQRPAFSEQGNIETRCQIQLLQALPRERH